MLRAETNPEPPLQTKKKQDEVTGDGTSAFHRKCGMPGAEEVMTDMEVDEDSIGAPIARKKSTHKTPSRIQKRRRGKPHAQMIFPSIRKRQKRKLENKRKG